MAKKSVLIPTSAVIGLMCAGPFSAEAQPATALLPPVNRPCISSPFGPRILPSLPGAGAYHHGVDLPAPEGAAVLAAGPGKLIRVQSNGPGGLEVLVQHAGFVGVYSHLATVEPAIAGGNQIIGAGDKLGKVGITGVTTGAHLYFEMIVGGKSVDPAPYLRVAECRGTSPPMPADTSPTDAKLIGGRKYYLLLPGDPGQYRNR